jgi:hypothetical protein
MYVNFTKIHQKMTPKFGNLWRVLKKFRHPYDRKLGKKHREMKFQIEETILEKR